MPKQSKNSQCCIALRDVAGTDDSNPYDFEKVKQEIYAACLEFGNKIKVVELPNITDVFYGRGVGYNIEQLELSKELQEVSATKMKKVRSVKTANLWAKDRIIYDSSCNNKTNFGFINTSRKFKYYFKFSVI